MSKTRVLARTLARDLKTYELPQVGGGHGLSCPPTYFLTCVGPEGLARCDPQGTYQP